MIFWKGKEMWNQFAEIRRYPNEAYKGISALHSCACICVCIYIDPLVCICRCDLGTVQEITITSYIYMSLSI